MGGVKPRLRAISRVFSTGNTLTRLSRHGVPMTLHPPAPNAVRARFIPFLSAPRAGGRGLHALVRAVKTGLVMMLPIVLLGSFALTLHSLPVPVWQQFLDSFAGGLLRQLLLVLHSVTFGLLSIYLVLLISFSLAQADSPPASLLPQVPITSLVCFFLLVGFGDERFARASLGINGMFTAIFAAIVSWACMRFFQRRHRLSVFYTEGSDIHFNNAVRAVLPSFLTIGLFVLFNVGLVRAFGVSGFQELFIRLAEGVFGHLRPSLFSALLYAFMTNLLWFFGVHGTNVLEGIFQHIFVAPDPAAASACLIFNKSFFDVFVAMGGSGATLALLLAVLAYSRHRASRRLGMVALGPMLFNINELIIFGLPVVFNVYLFIPFLAVPLLCTLTSYFAMASGLVPPATHAVAWTTPVLLGGYAATGSAAGSLLQAFNLMLGVAAYRPFVRLLDREKSREAARGMRTLADLLAERQEQGQPPDLLRAGGPAGVLARMLAADLDHALSRGELELHHQPQFDNREICVGSEALLRWPHPVFGFVPPPLVVQLAEESKRLGELERWVFIQAGRHAAVLRERDLPAQTSVNLTPSTLYDPAFLDFLRNKIGTGALHPEDLVIEITEQTPLLFTQESAALLKACKILGFHLAIDDFSMGHTSLKYLQDNEFDMVKLDGSLVRDLANPRSRGIIASIVSLAEALHFAVLAEYVENEDVRRRLADLGVTLYQGYLYSPALPFEEFAAFAKSRVTISG